MFSLLRRLRRDERGQALVIGAVVMLVLAVSIMASVSIGHGVYEKIKLQDAADAQAYSVAVKEARAYNFLAYTNRAMIVHYSAMLTFMSYVSHAVYLDKTIGTLAGYAQYIPPVSAIFAAIKQALEIWREAVEMVAKVLIPILSALNVALWLAQEAMMLGTLKDLLLTSSDGVVGGTDPKARPASVMSAGSGIGSVLGKYNVNFSNLKNFLHAVDDGPHSSSVGFSLADPTGLTKRAKLLNDNDLSDPNMAKYRLLMGNLANSVRREWTAVGKDIPVIGRRWKINLCLAAVEFQLNKTADSQIKSFDEDFEDNRKDQLFAADDITIRMRGPCALGRWKDILTARFRAAADAEGGFHQEYGTRKTGDHHDWMGITPFLTSDTSFKKPWQYHFSYPCNISILSKNMTSKGGGTGEEMEPFHLKNLRYDGENSGFMVESGSGQRDDKNEAIIGGYLDITWGMVGGVQNRNAQEFRRKTGGMMALSVGRAIYHRPGDWKEEPNFFNPLWTARLAPVKTHWEETAMEGMIREWHTVRREFDDALNY
ncbi:pilus assembly protein [Myxococcus llanfairpwllgwyngyllgogerychwyrndrobwllllantysiliogogogochensis]|uniref:Pilus assembly protein n=1 Tax=Myxococcus llanfairpwllgwyngyllgogerychwyrndrobwllllantysiliogogogochensis TaxID=2590453 RepID=A0A540X236_9BACT|nr:pilus assembly protein [Myxococcus llanfairpwllgwyngyllgogerychwyrndrobwllllantysiliogogogochensis]TQF15321.1 pilus assembly protein [Myxococcus llanfairpwllgwyngyllgogerychwyrndrobwllllantysiliogogogochensis]